MNDIGPGESFSLRKLLQGLTVLQQDSLVWLLDGSETALLLLHIHDDPQAAHRDIELSRRGSSEAQILEALKGLRSQGLVTSFVEKISRPSPCASGGVPEYSLGREQAVWWALTDEGRRVARILSEHGSM